MGRFDHVRLEGTEGRERLICDGGGVLINARPSPSRRRSGWVSFVGAVFEGAPEKISRGGGVSSSSRRRWLSSWRRWRSSRGFWLPVEPLEGRTSHPDVILSSSCFGVEIPPAPDGAGRVWFAPQVIWLGKPDDGREGWFDSGHLCSSQEPPGSGERGLRQITSFSHALTRRGGGRCRGRRGVSGCQPGFPSLFWQLF